MKNHVVGWYGKANCGDDAFKEAFRALYHGQEFRFDGGDEVIETAASTRVILGGGDVIKAFYLDRIPVDKPFSVIGCGLGYPSEIELLAGRKVDLALLRNRADADLAMQHGINAVYAPDICFALEPRAPRVVPESTKPKRIGVILSGHGEPGIDQPEIKEAAYFEYLKWELARFLDEICQYYEIHWISFSADIDHFDDSAHYSTRKKMSRRPNQHFWPYQPDQPLRQIETLAAMDAVLTMKFHGAIFATLQGIPFVSIGQTRKLLQYCEESGLGDLCVRPYAFTYDSAMAAIKNAERPETRGLLARIATENRNLLKQTLGPDVPNNPHS